MSSSSGDPTPGSLPPPPAGGGATPGGGAKRPSFLDPVPPPTLRDSPELTKIIWLGAGFLVLVMVALFFRPQRDSAPTLPEAPAVVETPEEHAQRIATAFGGALSKMVDGIDFQQSEAYLQIVEEVSKYDPASFHERTRGWLDWSVAVSTPGAVRGDFVRVRGVVGGDPRAVKLNRPAGDVEDVYRFIIGDADGTKGVVVDLVERPVETPEVLRHAVDFEGVFIRTLKYENAKGKMTEAPYVIARNLTIDVARSDGGHNSAVGAGIVAIGALIIVRLMMRKKPKRLDPHAAVAMHRPGSTLKELHELHTWQSKIAQARQEGAAKRALGTPPPSSSSEPKS